MLEIPLDNAINPELEDPDLIFGGNEQGPEFVVRLGDAPVGVPVRTLFKSFELPVPAGLRLYDRFNSWVIPHRVSIVRRRGMREITSAGIEIEYVSEGATCSIAALLPSPEYIEIGQVGANLGFNATMSATGEIDSGDAAIVPTSYRREPSLGLCLAASAGVDVRLAVTGALVTPLVQAVGLGSTRAEWVFKCHKKPLFGSDLETWSVLILPKRKRGSLRYRIRYCITSRLAFVPTRLESDWTELECVLAG